MAVSQGRYTLDISRCRAGNWVLLRGLGEAVQTTATVLARGCETDAVFCPLQFDTQAVVKLAIEPRNPSELPIMVEPLRKVGEDLRYHAGDAQHPAGEHEGGG